MMRRVPMRNARDLEEVAGWVAASAGPDVVIFDADNTLVPQGAPADEFRTTVAAAVGRFRAIAAVARVIVLTNGPRRGVPEIMPGGNKPWTTRRRLGLHGDHGRIVVVGDQVLTDGLLAWRLGATFVQLTISEQNESYGQALMRRIGWAVARFLFVPAVAAPNGTPG
jgi:predicted HAD superfamily phosphohydrolase YqeG